MLKNRLATIVNFKCSSNRKVIEGRFFAFLENNGKESPQFISQRIIHTYTKKSSGIFS